MSPAATRILHPDAVTYATGRPAITCITGRVEHIEFCGEGGKADLFIVAPCTANTLAKIALGIDDTPVTTFATTAIGRGMPVIIAPAMHDSMYRHPAIADHMKRLVEWGVDIVEPRIEEGKAKLATLESIVLHAERSLLGRPLDGKRVVVTSGPCAEAVDDVRILTTRSTGRMGSEMALQAFRLGADVTVVHSGDLPCVRNVRVRSAEEMREAVHHVFRDEGADIYVSAAAISDFAPKRVKGKIRSGGPVALDLQPLPKLLDEVIGSYHPVTIAFKVGRDEEGAATDMLDHGVKVVVVNTPEAMGAPGAEVLLLSRDGRRTEKGTKEEVAAAIWAALL